MKPEEAIRELSEMQEGIKHHGLKGQHYWFRWIRSQGKDIFTTSVEALEKQIPKKPNIKELPDAFGRLYWNVCGACDEEIESDYTYCPDCGQKINWEESP